MPHVAILALTGDAIQSEKSLPSREEIARVVVTLPWVPNSLTGTQDMVTLRKIVKCTETVQ